MTIQVTTRPTHKVVGTSEPSMETPGEFFSDETLTVSWRSKGDYCDTGKSWCRQTVPGENTDDTGMKHLSDLI